MGTVFRHLTISPSHYLLAQLTQLTNARNGKVIVHGSWWRQIVTGTRARFSALVRRQALEACARRCCLCHRFKGTKLEVHHIVPIREGGSNRAANAIALCFDCHSDVGHYNSSHPKGSRYSPEELRNHRDRWYEQVEAGCIKAANETSGLVVARHLVCTDFGIARQLVVGNFAELPYGRVMLATNPVLGFFRRLASLYGHELGKSVISLRVLPGRPRGPEGSLVSRAGHVTTDDSYPSFSYKRPATPEDLVGTLPDGGFLLSLLGAGVPASDLGIVLGHQGGECGGSGGFEEFLHVRTVALAFLEVENVAGRPVVVRSLRARVSRARDFRPHTSDNEEGEPKTLHLPAASIPSRGRLLVPEAVLLQPMESQEFQVWSTTRARPPHSTELSRCAFSPQSQALYRCIGPRLHVGSVVVEEGDGSAIDEPVHGLDLANTFLLAEGLQVGSCPHAFAISSSRALAPVYLGELFSECEGRAPAVVSEVTLPPGFDVLRVAELEDEETVVKRISCGGNDLLPRPRRLRRSEHLDVILSATGTIQITGFYVTKWRDRSGQAIWNRNELLARYLRSSRLRGRNVAEEFELSASL